MVLKIRALEPMTGENLLKILKLSVWNRKCDIERWKARIIQNQE